MARKLSPVYALIPLLYVAIVAVLLVLHFTSAREISERVGGLEVVRSVSSTRPLAAGGLKGIRIGYGSLGFLFTERRPLVLSPARGGEKKLTLREYRTEETGVELLFEQGVRAHIRAGAEPGEGFSLSFSGLKGLGDYRSLSCTLEARGCRLETLPGASMLRISCPEGPFLLALPWNAVFSQAGSRLVLSRIPGEAAPTFFLVREEEAGADPYLFGLARELKDFDPAAFEAELERFREKAFRYWQTLDFGSLPSAEAAERAGTAFLAEALQRGEYRPALTRFVRGYRVQADRSFRLTTPFVGGLGAFLQLQQRGALDRIQRITEKLRNRDLSVFMTPQLIPFLLDRAPFSLYEELIRFADSLQVETLPVASTLGVLEAYLEAGRWVGLTEALTRRIRQIIDHRLLAELRKSDAGIFLSAPLSGGDPGATVDLLATVTMGSLFLRAGWLLAIPAFGPLGQALIDSVLRRADPRGFVPARLSLSSSPAAPLGPALPPEELLLTASMPGYLPRETPLYRQNGPGAWIWSAAQEVGAQVSREEARFSFSFPVGEAHYFLLQGLPPAKGVMLHGVPWKPDPRYAQYTDGWFYEAEAQVFFGKLTHRNSREELVLQF